MVLTLTVQQSIHRKLLWLIHLMLTRMTLMAAVSVLLASSGI